MCNCAKSKTVTKTGKATSFELVDGQGTKHEFPTAKEAYAARATLGGKVRMKQ